MIRYKGISSLFRISCQVTYTYTQVHGGSKVCQEKQSITGVKINTNQSMKYKYRKCIPSHSLHICVCLCLYI